MKDLNKFKGCLLGGAVGDALGYTIEFMDENEIFKEFGDEGITRYRLTHGKARISDDTQMTLFTANGLLFGQTRGMMRGIGGVHRDYIRMAYLDWLDTQTQNFPYEPNHFRISWLANFEEFYHRRAPGTTCMSALRQGGLGTVEKPVNDSKGCGGVMRVAPIGLYLCDNEDFRWEEIAMLGAEAAAITHGHELGYIPAAALVHIIYAIASGKHTDLVSAVAESVHAMQALFPDAKEMPRFTSLMQQAIELSQKNEDDLTAIHALGRGWVAEETLAIAVYCALKYADDFEKAIITSVNHGGDSDSTGAVTGNILGTYLSVDAIPDYYLKDLELRDIIEEIAEDLYNDCQMYEFGDYEDPIWISKYIHIDYDAEKREELRK
jgi:ADP-ribosylglycohydrolase